MQKESKPHDNTRQPQNESCYQDLRRLLIHGQITPGTRLAEVKWSTQLEVHRSAFREAVSLLVHEGLLRRGEFGGVFVPALEKSDIVEIQEMRIAIEVGALKLASLSGLKLTDFDKMHQAIEVMQQTYDHGFEMGFCEADWRFHEALVELVGNHRLLRMYRQAPLFISFRAHTETPATQRARQITLQEHIEICQLLEDGKLDQAIVVLETHLFTISKLVPSK